MIPDSDQTVAFDSLWRLASERQRIFRARLAGHDNHQASQDAIVAEFRFTNAYRASDRTSQYLIANVIYRGEHTFRDTFARVVLFKLFNRIETWQLIASHLGEVTAASITGARLESVLDNARRRNARLYSAAYIMPPASQFGFRVKHRNHIRLLRLMLKDRVDEQVADARSMKDAFHVLLRYPSIGPFLAYQLATDLNYSPHLAFDERDFVMPGPGALDGISKCFTNLGDRSPADVVRWVADTQLDQFAMRGVCFDDLWGRELQLIDVQNLFCEVGKYARVAHPELLGVAGRSRIKQRFRPRPMPLTAWYPPKWGINERVRQWLVAPSRHGDNVLAGVRSTNVAGGIAAHK